MGYICTFIEDVKFDLVLGVILVVLVVFVFLCNGMIIFVLVIFIFIFIMGIFAFI